MNNDEDIRFVGKRFRCTKCNEKFTKLVRPNEISSNCVKCLNIANQLSEEEYKKNSRNNIKQNQRLPRSLDRRINQEEVKNNDINSGITYTTNILSDNSEINSTNLINENIRNLSNNNISPANNLQSDSRSRSTNNDSNNNLRRNSNNIFVLFQNIYPEEIVNTNNNSNQNEIPINTIIHGFIPLISSPFANNVNHHNYDNGVFNPIFQLFGTSFDHFFRDNFSSNFRSNHLNDTLFTIIIQQSYILAGENKKPPVSKEAIEKLGKFKMNEKYCKKNDKGLIEHPTCSICLSDIKMEEETLLVPCGHLYHCPCILNWFNQNNTCPVCRFELPPQKD